MVVCPLRESQSPFVDGLLQFCLLKIDFLGLRNLGVIDSCVKLIKKHRQIDIDKSGRISLAGGWLFYVIPLLVLIIILLLIIVIRLEKKKIRDILEVY